MSKRLKYFLLVLLIFALLGLSIYVFSFLNRSDFKILYEQTFNKKIDEVAFDSYEKDGSITYYPKIIVFSESDEFTIKREYKDKRFDDKKVFKKVNKEIRIFSPQGREITSIKQTESSPFGGRKIYMPENGNYFAIMQVVRMEEFYQVLETLYFSRDEIVRRLREEKGNRDKLYELIREKYESEYGKLIEPSFSVYNDKGELLWMNDTLLEADYMQKGSSVNISPVDGSILYSYIYWLGYYKIIDPSGNKRKAFPPELDDYPIDGFRIRFSEDWKYTAIGFEKYDGIYRKPPGKSYEPTVALLDSKRNVLWKKSLDNYLLSSVRISSQGSYIIVATYTMSGVDDKSPTKWTGYLFDKEGNLVMNFPLTGGLWREALSPFSENERYFASPDNEYLTLFDISEKKIIYEKDFPFQISGISVSNDGKCVLVRSEYDPLKYYPTDRPYAEAYVVDKKGDIVWDSGEIEEDSGEMEGGYIHLLGWDNSNPIIGIMNKEIGDIKIGKVLIR